MVQARCASVAAVQRRTEQRRPLLWLPLPARSAGGHSRQLLLSWTAVLFVCWSPSMWLLSSDAALLPSSASLLPSLPAHWTRDVGARRGLLTDLTIGVNVFMHVPSVSCQTELPAALLPNTTPACCTVTAADCASRCDSQYFAVHGYGAEDRVAPAPACIAFKFARQDPSPPLAGASQCVLLITASSCSVTLVPDPVNGIFQPSNPGTTVWDYYFRFFATPNPAFAADRRYAQLNITGMPADNVTVPAHLTKICQVRAWACDYGALLSLSLQLALSQRCCATNTQVTAASTGSGNGTAGSTSTWIVAIWPNWQTDSSPFLATRLDAVLADPPGAAALLAAIQATFASVTAVSYEALNTTGLTTATTAAANALGASNRTAAEATAADVQLWRSTAIGLAAALAAMLTLVLAHVVRLFKTKLVRDQTPDGSFSDAADKGATPDLFLSYRRHDVALADAVFDQLSLAGLRVFFDRAGDMAGRPFEEELYRALRDAAVTSIVVTLDGLRSCVNVHECRPDYWVAEVLLALHFSRERPGHHVYPILFGVPLPDGSGERRYLLTDPGYRAVIDALPDVMPTATLALVSRMLAADAGGVLDDALQGITVRQLMLGRPATAAQSAPFRGLLAIGSVPIHGPEDHMGLLLRHRYAVQVMNAVRATQCTSRQGKPPPGTAAELPECCAEE